MVIIDLGNMNTSNVSGESLAGGTGNGLHCDASGNAYLVSDGGGVSLQRIPAGTTAADPALDIDANGSNGSVVAGTAGAVAVSYNNGGEIFFSTHIFSN